MMPKEPMRGATLFSHANKMTQAYHIMLTPLCKEAGLPPLALDILLFLANNPEHNTAKDICRMRGHKSGIVSVHVERLVNDGLLERREMPGDRRQTRLICTEQAQALIERGRQVQWQFGRRLLEGIPEEDLATMRRCLERMDGNLNGICKEKPEYRDVARAAREQGLSFGQVWEERGAHGAAVHRACGGAGLL